MKKMQAALPPAPVRVPVPAPMWTMAPRHSFVCAVACSRRGTRLTIVLHRNQLAHKVHQAHLPYVECSSVLTRRPPLTSRATMQFALPADDPSASAALRAEQEEWDRVDQARKEEAAAPTTVGIGGRRVKDPGPCTGSLALAVCQSLTTCLRDRQRVSLRTCGMPTQNATSCRRSTSSPSAGRCVCVYGGAMPLTMRHMYAERVGGARPGRRVLGVFVAAASTELIAPRPTRASCCHLLRPVHLR